MSVNSLGWVAKRCACLRTSPNIRPNKARTRPSDGIPPLAPSSLLPVHLWPHPAPSSFTFEACFVRAFEVQCMNVPCSATRVDYLGSRDARSHHTFSAAQVSQQEKSVVAQGSLCIVVSDSSRCAAWFPSNICVTHISQP